MNQQTDKSIMYVSRENPDDVHRSDRFSEFPRIFAHARMRNKRAGVRGALGHQDGYYVQIIEGSPEVVDGLLKKIRLDRRHHDLQVLVDDVIKDRDISEKGFSLLNSETCGMFDAYCRSHAPMVANLDKAAIGVLGSLGWQGASQQSGRAHSVMPDNEAEDSRYFIREWPDFDVISPEPAVVESCAMLRSRYCSAQTIADSAFNGDLEAATRMLRLLGQQGILLRKAVGKQYAHAGSAQRRSGFYAKMRSFLKMAWAG